MKSTRKSQPAPAWLEESVYEPKRQHSVDLVRQSVDALVNQRKQDRKTRISLATIVAISKQPDPTGTGVAHTTILENAEAYAYYKKHRTTSSKTVKRRNQRVPAEMSGLTNLLIRLSLNVANTTWAGARLNSLTNCFASEKSVTVFRRNSLIPATTCCNGNCERWKQRNKGLARHIHHEFDGSSIHH